MLYLGFPTHWIKMVYIANLLSISSLASVWVFYASGGVPKIIHLLIQRIAEVRTRITWLSEWIDRLVEWETRLVAQQERYPTGLLALKASHFQHINKWAQMRPAS